MATIMLTGKDGNPMLVRWDAATYALEVPRAENSEQFDYTKISFVQSGGSSTVFVQDTVPEIYEKLRTAEF